MSPAWTEGGISLTLHAAILALLIITLHHHPPHDVTQPGTVAVVFEGGHKTATRQTEESRHSSPTRAPNPKATENQPPGATALPPSRPLPAPRPTPPQPTARPSPPSPATPLVPPAAPRAVPLPSAPRGILPQTHPHAPPRPRATPAHPAVPRNFATLSRPMMAFSLQGNAPPPASEGHLKRGINLAMAPNDQNSNIMTRYAEARHKLGEDWWAEFTEYVEEHKYYPMSAVERNEDGRCVLQLTIARDGRVLAVKLLQSTGSSRLDAAWVSEFRGAHVPPFPPGTVQNQITFPAAMDYILLHD